MRRVIAILASAALLFGATSLLAQGGVVIDRIIATVNKQPLLLSDWNAGVRMEAFLQDRQPGSFTEAERKAVLNRLIDRALLQQQMQADYSASDQEVKDRIQSIRAQFKGAETEEGWVKTLAGYELTPTDVEQFVRTQLQVMRFVDLRLRPTIRIDEEALQAYYRDTLVPEVKKTGAEPEPFQKVRPKIREILVQQKMDGVLESWLADLRSQSEVHIVGDPDAVSGRLAPGGGVEPKSSVGDHK